MSYLIIVESALGGDVGRIAELHHVARCAYFREAGYEPDSEQSPQLSTWADYSARPDMQLACAYSDTRPDAIGFACAYDGQEAGRGGMWSVELVALYVDPSEWGHGAGSALHDWYLHVLARSSTAEAGTLYVWSRNVRARSFYERRGWEDAGVAYPGPLDAPFVSLRLDRRSEAGREC